MAATLAADHKIYMSLPIVKTEETDDGIIVYGKASDGRVDSDDQIVAPDWSGPAIAKWLDTGGNVRVQHNPQLYPAGKGLSVEINKDGDGGHWVKSLVVEPTAMKLVRAGVLRAYSVGIAKPVIKRDVTLKARGGIVTGGEVAEISLVDRPANDGCGITLVKSAGDSAPWTHGDLVDLLVKAEAAAMAAKAKPDDEEPDEGDDKPEAGGDKNDPKDTDGGTMARQDERVQEGDDDEDEDDGDDVHKAYRVARAAWQAREPRPLADDISTGTGFLAKMAARDQWAAWDAEGDAEGFHDDTAAGFDRWVMKRQFDRGVGGGVDRDKLADSDFAGPDRSYPIVTPKDVHDAAGLVGHADDPDAVRERIKAIAHRKGPEFVAQLPEAWSGKNITTTAPLASGLVPFNLAGQNDDDEDKDKKDDVMEADLTKAGGGGKSCKRCGKTYHADAKNRRCENCGKKLPKASMGKAARALLTKAGIHNWKHGWIWIGPGKSPSAHEHMAAHHDAMAKGKWEQAAEHLRNAADRVEHVDPAKAKELGGHTVDIRSHAPDKSGKMTAAEKKLHQNLADAHRAAARGDHQEAERLHGEAIAGRQRLVRRHGAGKPEGEPDMRRPAGGNFLSVPVKDQKPEKRVPTTAARAGEIAARHFAEARRERERALLGAPLEPSTRGRDAAQAQEDARWAATNAAERAARRAEAKDIAAGRSSGLGHDSFDGRSRAVWQGEARREGVKPRRGAPAHEIAGMVGEQRARRAIENSLAINPYGHGDNQIRDATGPRKLSDAERAAVVERTVARFRAEHDAKVSRLGDPTGMGIYPTTAGNQAAHEARMRQARDEAARSAVSQGQHTITRADRGPGFHVHGPGAPGKDRKFASRAEAEYHIDHLTGQPAGTTRKNRPLKRVKTAGVDMNKSASDKKRLLPPDVKPAGPHREPDGTAVEDLEADAGIQEPGEAPETPDQIPASLKGLATYTGQRMHDALCPAYPWAEVVKTYPGVSTIADAVDPTWFTQAVLKAADEGDATGIVMAGILERNADAITKGVAEPAVLADARAELVKGFGGQMCTISPEQFRRPYINAGHAPLSAPAMRVPMVPPAAHTISPDDFHRGLITEGHQAESPGDRGDNLGTGGSLASGAARMFYSSASVAAAKSTMRAMHDHIADTLPGMCPMADSRYVMPPDMQASNRPHPAAAPFIPNGPGGLNKAEGGLTKKRLAKLIKSAVADEADTIRATYQQQIDALQAEIDYLGSQPDPAQAPVRGAVMVNKAATLDADATPVERISLVEKAQQAAVAMREQEIEFAARFLNHPDPAKREIAEQFMKEQIAAAT